jgi:hypothetical protein
MICYLMQRCQSHIELTLRKNMNVNEDNGSVRELVPGDD